MIWTLAVRHLLVRRLRALVLLTGFAIGVAVMIVLLSVGEAMLAQSRDVALVGGGEVTVLPAGVDVEALRTGGVSGMFFGIDRARFVVRQLLGGPRQADIVRVVSPVIENKLLYLEARGRVVPVRAGGELPGRAAAVGAAARVVAGRWADGPADSAWVAPTAQQLYDELDRFHLPPGRDSTWGEWHYFNVVLSPGEWWYVTYLVGGDIRGGRWGGQLLVTHRRPDGGHERFEARFPATAVRFDTARADLALGGNSVEQRDGRYRLRGTATGATGTVTLDLEVRPLPNRYFPPAELRGDDVLSGYVVPGLAADASGRICRAGKCVALANVPAYHDHNWGVWRDVTWEWGAARGTVLSLLYGGVLTARDRAAPNGTPFFLALADSLGTRQVLRFGTVRYEGSRAVPGSEARAPERFTFLAAREADTARVHVEVLAVQATRSGAGGYARWFLQMRGRFALEGRIGGEVVRDAGEGFFETYVPAMPR